MGPLGEGDAKNGGVNSLTYTGADLGARGGGAPGARTPYFCKISKSAERLPFEWAPTHAVVDRKKSMHHHRQVSKLRITRRWRLVGIRPTVHVADQHYIFYP